jgi:hypothetical protein
MTVSRLGGKFLANWQAQLPHQIRQSPENTELIDLNHNLTFFAYEVRWYGDLAPK